MRSSKASTWLLLGRTILFMLGCASILAAVAPLFSRMSVLWQGVAIGLAGATGAYLLTVLFLRWEGLSLQAVGADFDPGSPVRLLLGFLVGMLVVGTWAAALSIFSNLKWAPESDIPWFRLPLVLAAYLALAAREELAFHGFPLRRLASSFGVWKAQIFVAVVFALEHRLGGSSWLQAFVGSGIGSLLFGMASIATRGLAVPIGVHAAWNCGQWMLGLKGPPGIWKAIIPPGHSEDIEVAGMAIYVAVTVSATLLFYRWNQRRSTRRQVV
jgi:uncharacterized protein